MDGDTIRVEIDGINYPIRYIGMDTPEPDTPDPVVKGFATAATAANAAMVEGREVILERDVSETDRFDRLLRNVWIEDRAGNLTLVNLELVKQGFAQVTTYPPDVKYVDLLTEAQQAARTAEVGLWAPEPLPAAGATPLALIAGQQNARCDPSYPGVCIPPGPPDLNCSDITERRFVVLPPDPHNFDGNHDGIGCVSD